MYEYVFQCLVQNITDIIDVFLIKFTKNKYICNNNIKIYHFEIEHHTIIY